MKKPSKSSIEHLKTIVIVVLVTSILAFIGGIKYAEAIQVAPPVPVQPSKQ